MPDFTDRERRAHVAFQTTEPTDFGHGFISGFGSALLGMAALGVVVSLRFPGYVAFDELRPIYASPYLRALIHLALWLPGTKAATRAR